MITIVLDYPGKRVIKEVRKKIETLGLKIAIAYRTKKLKSIIEILQRSSKENIKKNEPDNKFQESNVVYKLSCLECVNKPFYVGETSRKHIRKMKGAYFAKS